MEVYEIAYLFLGLATLVAASAIINYSRKRSAASPDSDIKKAFRPLYIFAFGLIIFGIGSLITFYGLYNEIVIWQYNVYLNFYYVFYIFTLIELFFLSISAAMIMQQRLIFIFMMIMIIFAGLLVFNAVQTISGVSRVSNLAELYINFGNVLSMLLLGANAVLFLVIANETKRSTSLALGYAMTVQVLAVPRLYCDHLGNSPLLPVEFVFAISILALMGPAMIAFAFLRPDQKISAELIGYGASFAGPVIVISSLFSTGIVIDAQIIALAILGSVAIAFASGTASYTYGRWRETRQLPTALLMVIFTSLAAGQIVGMLGSFTIVQGTIPVYFDFVATSFSLAIFSAIAIIAAGYRTAASIPLLLYIPTAILMVQSYPAPISTAFLNYYYLGIPVLILFFVPVILFARVWRRMKSARTPGRMRPLGMSIGILIYIIIRFTFLLLEFPTVDPGYGLVVIPYAVLWLSITGRLDRL
ncbi:MAG: hypothetical protein ACFFCT_09320 [Candidatus Odinarchaeota archaeon]